MSGRTRVAVLVSGTGTNLSALLEAADSPSFPADVVLVLSNRRDCPALTIAQQRGVRTVSMPVSAFGNDAELRDQAMLETLAAADVELIVLAGYNRVLSDAVLRAFPDAIVNVHPSLLPAFGGGMDAVEQALAAGVRVTGCTVHLLAEGAVDGGPILLQAAVPVEEGDDAAALRGRIHREEWRLLPQAVELWATGRLQRDGSHVRILPAARQRQAAG